MRNHKAGSITEAVALSVDATGQTHKKVSEFLGIRPSTLSYGMELSEERPGGLGINYLHRLGEYDPACAAPIAQHFAALAGGTFSPIESDNDTLSAIEHMARIGKEYSEGIIAMSKLPEGGCKQEARKQLADILEVVEAAIHDIDARPDNTVPLGKRSAG